MSISFMALHCRELQIQHPREFVRRRHADIPFAGKKPRNYDLGNPQLLGDLIHRPAAAADCLFQRFGNRRRDRL